MSKEVTEKEKEEALELLQRYSDQQSHQIRGSIEEDCPSQDFENGVPSGVCDGDGHYMCDQCINKTAQT